MRGILLAMALAAAVGPAHRVGTLELSAAALDQREVALAFGGGVYLAVWVDGREGEAGVAAARLSSTGQLLDATGLSISPLGSHPSVAAQGSSFVVVWQARGALDDDLFFARVTAEGLVVDPGGQPLCTAAGDQRAPRVVVGTQQGLVVWEDLRTGTPTVHAARLGAGGQVLDPGGFAVAPGPLAQREPAVAAGAGGFFVAWADERGADLDVWGARLTGGGEVLDAQGLVLSGALPRRQRSPAVAFDGTSYLVAWLDERVDPAGDVYGARVAPATGAVLDPAGLPLAPLPQAQWRPSVACGAASCLVAFHDHSGFGDWTRAVRVGPQGQLLDATPLTVAIGREPWEDAVAFGAGAYRVGFRRDTPLGADLFHVGVSEAGLPSPEAPLALGAAAQRAPLVALGEGWQLAWSEASLASAGDLRLGFVWADGSAPTPGGRELATAAAPLQLAWARGARGTLMAWTACADGGSGCDPHGGAQDLDLFVASLTPDGGLSPAWPLAATPASELWPAVAWNDGSGRFLVTWLCREGGDDRVLARTLSADGVPDADAGWVLSSVPAERGALAAAPRGNGFYVVWGDGRDSLGGFDLWGAQLDADGGVIEAQLTSSSGHERAPALAACGASAVLAWESVTTGASTVWRRTFEPDGGGASEQLSTAAAPARAPAAACAGDAVAVAWREGGAAASVRVAFQAGAGAQDDAAWAAPGGFELGAPALALDARRVALVADEEVDLSPPVRNVRLGVRLVAFADASLPDGAWGELAARDGGSDGGADAGEWHLPALVLVEPRAAGCSCGALDGALFLPAALLLLRALRARASRAPGQAHHAS